ncbi:MAG: NAD(P)H-dependent oxidoreductase subunit E, partial [Gammaproteobacteria bacterium]
MLRARIAHPERLCVNVTTIKKRGQIRGRAVDPTALAEVRELLGEEPGRRDLLIEHLHRIQDRFHCLPAAHLVALAEEMRLATTEVYEVATFYHHFDVVKEGEARPPALTVRICDSVTCELFGARELFAGLEERLGEGVRMQHVPCVGRCQAAPVAVVGQNPIEAASVDRVEDAVIAGETEAPLPTCIRYAAYRREGGYETLAACAEGRREREAIVKLLEDSKLRGLGGAGFPAGRKWRILRDQPKPRLVAINIDEGEPGTFKDRHYLERDPHRFLEGMLIATWTIEAEAVYIYLRDEYAGCRRMLGQEIDALTQDPPCPLPSIHLRRGAGAYICGEESAMIESIEGKRGMPRLRPPYVAEVGLFGRPTLEHNLETLHWVRDIIE